MYDISSIYLMQSNLMQNKAMWPAECFVLLVQLGRLLAKERNNICLRCIVLSLSVYFQVSSMPISATSNAGNE